MKILLIGNYTGDQQYSMLGFADTLLSGLLERGVDARLIAPVPRLGKLPAKRFGIGKWLGYGDKYLLFPRTLARELAWADLVHICDQGSAIYVNYVRNKPHVVTCHDMLAILAAQGRIKEWATGGTGRIYQKLIHAGLGQASYVACVSEATRGDLLAICRIPKERTSVIYNGFYRPSAPMEERESEPYLAQIGIRPGERFLLHVGGNQPYKNRAGVLEIYAALRGYPAMEEMRMVMAGKRFAPELRRYVESNKLGDFVLERSGLDDDHIRALYSRATALIYPSFHEGFGLPIIEAQALGCPVFTSDRAPMTEVGGAGAIYFDPAHPQQAAKVIADNFGSLAPMAAAGRENVGRFSTARMLDEYIATYHRVLDCSQ